MLFLILCMLLKPLFLWWLNNHVFLCIKSTFVPSYSATPLHKQEKQPAAKHSKCFSFLPPSGREVVFLRQPGYKAHLKCSNNNRFKTTSLLLNSHCPKTANKKGTLFLNNTPYSARE